MKKGFTVIEILVILAIAAIIISVIASASHARVAKACGWFSDCNTEQNTAATTQAQLVKTVPVPVITNSLERQNVANRATLFDSPDKISYIYLLSYGKVMAFYTVKGKVSSLRSYMFPETKLVYGDGTPCNYGSASCYPVDAADIDGTYGENVEGIFFFTTEGAYVEWKGDYMMSDQPLKLSTQPELIREVK